MDLSSTHLLTYLKSWSPLEHKRREGRDLVSLMHCYTIQGKQYKCLLNELRSYTSESPKSSRL